MIKYLAIISEYYTLFFDKYYFKLTKKNTDNSILFKYTDDIINNYLADTIKKLANLLEDDKYDEAYTFFKSL